MDDCQNYSTLFIKPHIAIFYATRLYFLSAITSNREFPCNMTIFSLQKVRTMLGKMLGKNNYFKTKISVEREALSNIDYGSNYNEIFENNSLELDVQIPPIDKLNTQLDSKSLSEIDYGDGINELYQDDGLLNSNSSHQSNDISSMVDLDMLKSSPTLFPSGRDHFFLTSALNWEPVSTREISTKMKEVKSVCQVINTHFKLKATPWQVDAVMDVTKHKKDICAIADTNAGKSFVDQSIPVVTSGSVLEILPTIAFMEK